MAHPNRATFGTGAPYTNLPPQFSYRPYVPRKRYSVQATANAVIFQYAKPTWIVHGDGGLAWTCEACYPTEWNQFLSWYNDTTPTLYRFTGYWGDVFDVRFVSLDQPSVRGRLFDVSGMFQVVCVVSAGSAACAPA